MNFRKHEKIHDRARRREKIEPKKGREERKIHDIQYHTRGRKRS